MKLPKPINKVEEKIIKDKEFLTAIKLGRPRAGHSEGTVGIHVIHIINYIDKNYKNKEYYKDLRIIALLHDIGKFAFLEERRDEYLPKLSENESKKMISECRKFKKKYYLQRSIPKNMRKYNLTTKHAYASYQFAKKFLQNKKILELIRYHDLAQDMKWEYDKTKTYDTKIFKKIFTNINLKVYVKFLECDNCNRIDNTSEWLKKQLKSHKLL